ncbi:hypothetical protein SPPR111872_04080 [Sphingobacterium prati]
MIYNKISLYLQKPFKGSLNGFSPFYHKKSDGLATQRIHQTKQMTDLTKGYLSFFSAGLKYQDTAIRIK